MAVSVNNFGKQLMIGGQALDSLGSSRHTEDVDYLVIVPGMPTFIHDKEANTDYINAAGKDTNIFRRGQEDGGT